MPTRLEQGVLKNLHDMKWGAKNLHDLGGGAKNLHDYIKYGLIFGMHSVYLP